MLNYQRVYAMVKNMVCFAIKGDNHYKEFYCGMDGHKPYTMCFDRGSYAFCSRIYPLVLSLPLLAGTSPENILLMLLPYNV
jgi:hypothetical protein